jgi:hypothetical protein
METLIELQTMLKRLSTKWDSGSISSPQEIVKMDRQMKELKKKIQHLKG